MRWALRTATLLALAAAACTGGAVARPQPLAVGPPAIPDAQPAVNAPLFTGENAFATPLGRSSPDSTALSTDRSDGANTGVVDGAAPLGKSPVTGSDQVPVLPPLVWDRRGGLTAGCQVQFVPDIVKQCLAAVDPTTFAVTARWLPPAQDLNLASLVVDAQQRVLVTTRQGHVIVLQRPEEGGGVFRLVREVDVSASLGPGEQLSMVRPDTGGNLWFTTGGRPAGAAPNVTTTTVGFVTPDGQVATMHLADQLVETDFAVGRDQAYLATSPAGAADHAAATGFLYRLAAATGQLQVVWRQPYDAGGGRKPGAVTRGTGSPVLLLGDRYVAITDNAEGQVHLEVFAQAGAIPAATSAAGTTEGRLVCHVPLFSPGASAVTSAPIGYASGAVASVVVANGYNAPPAVDPADKTAAANNMNQMAAGLTRVDIAQDGSGCSVAWSDQLRFKAPPVLSTATGFVYGYSQDEQRASAGTYIWYFVSVDFATGRVAWRQRAGAGGTKNDNLLPASLGPGGTLYQSVAQGVVWMRDLGQRP